LKLFGLEPYWENYVNGSWWTNGLNFYINLNMT
jgi:hypothetical protein